ncbi:helix-turn-helix transcriptional regulator [Actinomadura sp. ATCC 31491]|uniref:Helix-turn-helix transcriptional regulator n=1 Tax=Actinomadura luzonensis TaxID=2805427 RepID=A0ABT0G159_9ACTN|nr:helix-turn-helix transcriptional regulator [Actinomadura luzonensis]MCK2218346.1 helix-turn-helix transcriptional regulator [Actinomadura luzonensis]
MTSAPARAARRPSAAGPAAARPDGVPMSTVFDTTDPERAMALLAAAYGAPVRFSGGGEGYRFRHTRLAQGPLSFDTIDHTATTEYRAEPFPALIVVRVHRGVRTDLDRDEHLGPGGLAVHAQPGRPFHARLASIRHTAVLMPPEAVAEAARNRPDDPLPPLRFTSLRPIGPAAARAWLLAADYVAAGLRLNPEAMAQPLLAGAATRLLAAHLLATFPTTWHSEPHHLDRTDATPTTLARATAFIDASADLDITALDIARAAHVTVRAVQLAFRRHARTTPMAYLRRVRLERAHEQLRAAAPGDGTTVTAVAARWGFFHPGRFAALYQQTYGQPPSRTLRA